jgi:hypothetical protein
VTARSLIPRLTDIIEAIERIHSVLADMPLDPQIIGARKSMLATDQLTALLRGLAITRCTLDVT